METKKTYRVDLERFHTLFLETGIALALMAVLLLLHWQAPEKPFTGFDTMALVTWEEEAIPVTRPETPTPPTHPVNQPQLVIVEDDMEISQEFQLEVEATPETKVRVYEPLPVMTEEEPEVEEEQVFIVVEEMPSFPGGETARLEFLARNLVYPALAREAGIEGTVFITFVVQKDGTVGEVRVLRGIGGGCDQEAMRVVRSMPAWHPGRQRGMPVKVQFNMPIRFELNSG